VARSLNGRFALYRSSRAPGLSRDNLLWNVGAVHLAGWDSLPLILAASAASGPQPASSVISNQSYDHLTGMI